MTKEEYLSNPCGTFSLPYYKSLNTAVPDNMKILHERDFKNEYLKLYNDTPYFRLIHYLKNIAVVKNDDFKVCLASDSDINIVADIINRSYSDISVDENQLMKYRNTEVCDADLWIIVYTADTKHAVGCGIADFDEKIREGSLEWVQVIPEYRKRGVGSIIVNHLLYALKVKADFVTVSGKINSLSNPEALYRKCGFVGNDIWHVLTKR